MHRSDIRAKRVVNMERRESENNSGNEWSQLVFYKMIREKIRPKTGKDERQEKKQIVAGYPPDQELEISINRDYIEFWSLDQLESPGKQAFFGNKIGPIPRYPDNLHSIRSGTGNGWKKMAGHGPGENDSEYGEKQNYI